MPTRAASPPWTDRPRRTRRGALGVALAVVLVAGAACGGDGEGGGDPDTPEELSQVLQERYDMTAEQASCVADQVFARLSPDEIATLRGLGDGEPVPDDIERTLRRALTPCA